MTLPAGVDPAYAICLVWVGFAALLLTVFHQLSSVESVREKVASRTFARLLSLNDFLNQQIETQWRKLPSPAIIPDLQALIDLRRRVARAATVQRLFERRTTLVEWGRMVAVLQILAAVFAAAAIFFGFDRRGIREVGQIVFGGLTFVCVALLGGVAWTSAGILHGNDF